MTFTWIPFYKELSQKLLKFKNDRVTLVDWIYNNLDGHINHLKDDKNGKRVPDIDPFTLFAIFNRGIKDEKRIDICNLFKQYLYISASIPENFDAIPIIFNKQSNFMAFEDKRKDGDIDRLWDLFEAAVQDRNIKKPYEALRGQYLIKFNITIGLFWIRPDKYLPLDGNCKKLLNSIGITYDDSSFLPYKDYSEIMNSLNTKMKTESLSFSNYVEFSYHAYQQNTPPKKENKGMTRQETHMAGEQGLSSEKVNYWWLVANPTIWSLSEMQIGEEQERQDLEAVY